MIIDGGYLVINLTYRFSTEIAAHSVVKSRYDSFSTFGYCSNLTWTSSTGAIGSGNWPMSTLFQAKLKIGDWFYNGEGWDSYSLFEQKQSHWNQIYTGWGWDLSGHTRTWYAIRDSVFIDEWEYTNKATYDAFSGEKTTGKCEYAHAQTAYNTHVSEYVAIPKDFNLKLTYGASFFLAHNNKVTETIYDADYQLTNTVNWKMNLADIGSNGGVAIKCPND